MKGANPALIHIQDLHRAFVTAASPPCLRFWAYWIHPRSPYTSHAQRTVHLFDGRVVEEEEKRDRSRINNPVTLSL